MTGSEQQAAESGKTAPRCPVHRIVRPFSFWVVTNGSGKVIYFGRTRAIAKGAAERANVMGWKLLKEYGLTVEKLKWPNGKVSDER